MLSGKIGVMIVGMNGATANTLIVGSRLSGQDGENYGSVLSSKEFKSINFPRGNQFVFGGWDINKRNAYQAAIKHNILPEQMIEHQKAYLTKKVPYRGIAGKFDVTETSKSDYCEYISNFKTAIDLIKGDIQNFRAKEKTKHCIVIYLGPPLKTSRYKFTDVNKEKLESMINNNSKFLTSAMAYAIASIESGCAFIDFTPNQTLEMPAMNELAIYHQVPLAGRDGNTGQSLLKTVISEMLRVRNLRLTGWYSTNILGNNDGLVLSRLDHRQTKMEDKLGVIGPILGYKDFDHVIDISFYPPRGDNKESWDNIDFLGWLGLPMCMKINWLGRDSVLAAPLLLDLIRHLCYSIAKGGVGIQEHLAIYFKHPLGCGVLSFTQGFEKLKTYYELK